jgi:Flp pilus assembly protein TadD
VRGAIARFEEVARLRPNDPEVHKQLGRAWMRAGDVASARRAYRRYLELAPNAPDRTLIEQMISD